MLTTLLRMVEAVQVFLAKPTTVLAVLLLDLKVAVGQAEPLLLTKMVDCTAAVAADLILVQEQAGVVLLELLGQGTLMCQNKF
jgi:hypothetical protein